MRKYLLFVLAIVLTACSSASAATEVPSELENAQQKWQDASISHYRFNLNMVCFCAFAENMPLVIEVQDGQVVSMAYENGNEIDPASLEFFQRYETIDKLFAELEKAQGGEADKVTVSFDDTYGFPVQIDIDVVEEAIDDELNMSISGFEVLP